MPQIKERSTIFLQYETLEDLLKVIVYSAQSSLGLTPMLYYINYRNQEILFILTGASGGIIINYIIQNEKPSKKFIELKRLSGEFSTCLKYHSFLTAEIFFQSVFKSASSLSVKCPNTPFQIKPMFNIM